MISDLPKFVLKRNIRKTHLIVNKINGLKGNDDFNQKGELPACGELYKDFLDK
jgi:hypothetical protein